MDVGPLPHCLGLGGSVQLGLRSVGFSLPAALRGVSLDFVLIVTWWMRVPALVVDVGSSTS